MILNTDEETLKNTIENAPITCDLLTSLGFVITGQQEYGSHKYMCRHQTYCTDLKFVIFYHHKKYDGPELDKYPENMLLVKTTVVDYTALIKDPKRLYISTTGQLMKYVEYLKKRDHVNVLENEIHNLLEESFFDPEENN